MISKIECVLLFCSFAILWIEDDQSIVQNCSHLKYRQCLSLLALLWISVSFSKINEYATVWYCLTMKKERDKIFLLVTTELPRTLTSDIINEELDIKFIAHWFHIRSYFESSIIWHKKTRYIPCPVGAKSYFTIRIYQKKDKTKNWNDNRRNIT